MGVEETTVLCADDLDSDGNLLLISANGGSTGAVNIDSPLSGANGNIRIWSGNMPTGDLKYHSGLKLIGHNLYKYHRAN